ncbi:endolytic transglycosylase MltG [Spongiibacter taiwanensis]|uniref:endolytic transglycosylase MltG n=1 Tax=Spongiibacter taiwanensis TaxID=1748242 RepID=UPI002034AEB5|nr:endolytic transglycosylase MltG [Spongiibacter taiwanensis]USA43385.1 endolytic transglycosylase MltG [Spongiibacter taiwanensis]
MRKLFRLLMAGMLPLLFLALLAAWYFNANLNQSLDLDDERSFILPVGTGFSAMVNQLQAEGLIERGAALKLYGRLYPPAAQIRAGEYRLLPGQTVAEALSMMQSGQVVRHQLTLVEGWSLSQVIKYLSEQSSLQTQALPADETLWAILGVDDPIAPHPEGAFFPDTYDYHLGEQPSVILNRAYRKMLRVLDEEWQARDAGLPYQSPYEALIMASIIEKETGVAYERDAIAGVFVRRLAAGMRLQTDPTVIYGIGDAYAGNLRGTHLRDESNLYNTYRHNGLPPTPIALAGREAIHAAMHPGEGDALFFVAKGDGTHQFSATLAEHEAAVRHYQIEKRRSDYRSAPPVNNQPTSEEAAQ